MRVKYRVYPGNVTDDSGERHTVYGIEAISDTGAVSVYRDLFFDEVKARQLAELCNSSRLALIHLADVVDDALAKERGLG